MKPQPASAWLLVAASLLLGGCNYDFPLTAQPTRPVETRLLGDWLAENKEDNKTEQLSVRRLDDATYAVAIDGDIYRAFHSDFAQRPFLSVQDLNSTDRKYLYYLWHLSADGDHLGLQPVSDKVIPDDTKDAATIQRLIRQNLANPKLLGEELQFTRKKAGFR